MVDSAVERIGDFERPLTEARVDSCDSLAEGVGELGRAHVDEIGDVGDALVERGNDLFAAVAERFGDVDDAGRQRVRERLRAALERILEAPETLVESGGDLVGLRGDAIVEIVDVASHRLGDVLRARAEPLDEFGAVSLHRAVEFGEMPGDEISERRGIARNLFAEFGAGVIEHLLESGKARRQHLFHGVAARGNDADDVLGALANRVGHRGAARNQRLGDAIAGLLQLGRHFAAAQIEVENERLARGLERAVDLVGAGRDRFGQLARGFDDGVGELLRPPDHQIDHRERFLGEIFGNPVEPGIHHVFEAGGDFGEFLADVIGLKIKVRAETLARHGDRARGLVAGSLQAIEQIAAALAQLLNHIVADLAERERDLLAPLGQRMGDALRGLVDLLADEVADRGQILREIDVHVIDGGAHLLGLPDQRVALVGEILQQPANPYLVFAVGAFERGNLALHQRLQLARARQRPLDAVAHGRDLAADRLSDSHDGIPCHAFGFGEPHGDPRHRLRDQAQFLRAPGHVGHAEKEDDRQQRRGAKTDHQRDRRAVGTERGMDVRKIDPREREAADNPDAGKRRGDEIGRARGPTLQRLQDLADRLLIVVGDAERSGRQDRAYRPGRSRIDLCPRASRSRSALGLRRNRKDDRPYPQAGSPPDPGLLGC